MATNLCANTDENRKVQRQKPEKMGVTKKLSICMMMIVIGVVVGPVGQATGSVLTARNGVYKRLTVRFSDAVPRQFCQRAINNLQVSTQASDI